MIYDCCHCCFVPLYFTINDWIHSHIAQCSSSKALYDNIKCYLYCVDVDWSQMDWQLICTLNALMLLKALIVKYNGTKQQWQQSYIIVYIV